jgi:hypothetical protein
MTFVFNVALGREAYYGSLPAASDALVVIALKASGLEDDAALRDYDTVAAVLAASNDEADFTNYARKTITSVTVTVDDSADEVRLSIGDQTWTSAGGATNNQIGKLVVAYDPATGTGTDADLVPISAHDWSVTTNGADLTADEPDGGFVACG